VDRQVFLIVIWGSGAVDAGCPIIVSEIEAYFNPGARADQPKQKLIPDGPGSNLMLGKYRPFEAPAEFQLGI